MSVKYPTYVNLTSSSKEHPNERTPSPPPRKKSLSPPQAPSKFISSKSTHYTSASSPSESPTPTYVVPSPKLCFVIPIKQEPQELPIGPLESDIRNPFPFIGKGIRVYKFSLVYVASIKWVVELPFNARLLSSTRYSPLRNVVVLLYQL
ncbi:hypothetical protein Tco_0890461 [Tanacetum coccineum]|uniref:Uncharacterized protein n=1 Tax=Tanacetum coccineum TaxID=301880 RepID=A0ABQ5C1Z0_9ASTR